jgi:hypothetical protein
MQVDHLVTAGRLVQAIDVLRDELFDPPFALEVRERVMGRIGARTVKPPPADEAASPVAAPNGRIAHEGLEEDRLRALPAAVRIAVVGYAGLGAATRAGEHEEARMALDEVAKRLRLDVRRPQSTKKSGMKSRVPGTTA